MPIRHDPLIMALPNGRILGEVMPLLRGIGAAQLGIAGNDVVMEFDYSEIYAPLDLDVGHCRLAVAATADALGQADVRRSSHVRVATKYPEVTRRHFAAQG